MIPEHMTDLREAIHFIADLAFGAILILWCWSNSRHVRRMRADHDALVKHVNDVRLLLADTEVQVANLEAWQRAVWSSDEERVTDIPNMNHAAADHAEGLGAPDTPAT